MLFLSTFLRRWISQLRFPVLAIISAILLIINVLIIDPIPFFDELLMLSLTALFASLKKARSNPNEQQKQ